MKQSKSICTLLAKVGHKIEGDKDKQAKILEREYCNKNINSYTMYRLSTIQDILSKDNDINDLISLSEQRNFSLDYDYKRKPIDNGFTIPFKNMEEFLRYRHTANNLRATKNLRATPMLVEYYQARSKQNVRHWGSSKKDCIRHFIRALIQSVHPFKKELTYAQISNKLSPYGVRLNDLKNANRKPFVANMVFNNSTNRRLIKEMLKSLNIDSNNNYQEYLDLLIHKGISNTAVLYN